MALTDRFKSMFSAAPAAVPTPPAKVLEEDAAAPADDVMTTPLTGQVRRAVDALYKVELTPATALRAMRAARDLSDVPMFVATAMEALRRNPNLQSVLQTRVLAVASLPLIAEPGGKKLADRKAAEAVQPVLSSEAVEGVVPHLLLTGAYLGFGVAQLFWDTSSTPWAVVSARDVEPHFVTFDKRDSRTPLLLPATAGAPLEQLPHGKFIYHRPGLLPGNPATSSIAYAVLFYEALKGLALQGWVGFAEVFGQPLRLGRFPLGHEKTPQGRKDVETLKRALRELGADAWAALPEGMKIEIIEAAGRNGSAEVYERLCRFIDEQVARLVLGGSLTSGTGNTGSGGSQALGSVHNELRIDILKADAKALANSIRRCLVRPYVAWNHGPTVATPTVYFQLDEAEDVGAWVTATNTAMQAGLRVPVSEFYTRLDIRPPEGDEEVLGGLQAPSTEALRTHPRPQRFSASGEAENNEGAHDELDDLADELFADDGFVQADADADELLLNAIANARDADELRAALIEVVRTGDVAALQAVLTAAPTAARLVGEAGFVAGGE